MSPWPCVPYEYGVWSTYMKYRRELQVRSTTYGYVLETCMNPCCCKHWWFMPDCLGVYSGTTSGSTRNMWILINNTFVKKFGKRLQDMLSELQRMHRVKLENKVVMDNVKKWEDDDDVSIPFLSWACQLPSHQSLLYFFCCCILSKLSLAESLETVSTKTELKLL